MSVQALIRKNRLLFAVMIFLTMGSSLFGQESTWKNPQSVKDSIAVLNRKNQKLKQANVTLSDSAKVIMQRIKAIEDNIAQLSAINYAAGQSIFSYYVGGGLAPILYNPEFGKKSNEFGYTTGFSYSYFWKPKWGLKVGLSLDRFGSSLKIDGLERSTPSIDGDIDSDAPSDPFNLLTNYSGIVEKQNAMLLGTALQISYRTKMSDKWYFVGSIGPKLSFSAVSESVVSDGSYTTQGEYPQYGAGFILTEGPGFGSYTPRSTTENKLDLGISLVGDMDFAYKLSPGFALFTGPYIEYQLNSQKRGSNDALVSYNVGAPQPNSSTPLAPPAESVYNSVLNSNSISNFSRFAVGLRIGINFDLGAHKNHRKSKVIDRYRNDADRYGDDKDSYEDLMRKNVQDSLDNAKRIEELRLLYDQMRSKEKADSISAALKRAELARLAERQRIKDSIENANKVGVIMDIRTKQLTADDLELLKLPIMFEFGTAILTEISKRNVNTMAAMLVKYPTLKYQVTGHTCDIGSDKANLIIGLKRANVIKDAFTRGGMEGTNIKTDTRGKAEPMVPNINENNRRKNRRVVVIIED